MTKKDKIIKYALNMLIANIDEVSEEDLDMSAEQIEQSVKEIEAEIPTEDDGSLKLEPLPKPIGQFIIDQGVEGVMLQNGKYYHYADVCNLLKKYKEQ